MFVKKLDKYNTDMKKCFFFPFLTISVLFSSCDKEDETLRDFYLSQPRDQRLVGIWKSILSEDDTYVEFGADGWQYDYYFNDFTKKYKRSECWYTLNDSILKIYYYSGTWFKGSREYEQQKYRIHKDTLYFKVNGTYRPCDIRSKDTLE